MAASPAGRFAVFVVKADHVQDGTATSPVRREISVSLALGPRAAAIILQLESPCRTSKNASLLRHSFESKLHKRLWLSKNNS